MAPKTRIVVSAGESSGDAHAANLVREVLRRRPDIEFEGFGGEGLAHAGCRVHEDLVSVASMGFKFAAHFRRYARAIRTFDRILAASRPGLVLLVDSPGLNFALARLARWRGVPVAYYICPQIWAWAPWRRAKVLKYTDLLLTILPFEEELYRNPRVPVVSVGHPLGDSLGSIPPRAGEELRARLRVPPGDRVIAILPGSRKHEVLDLMPLFRRIIDGMGLDPRRHRIIISSFKEAFRARVEQALFGCRLPHEVLADDARVIAQASDLVLVTSGTMSLEVAYFQKPMLVLYHASAIQRLLFRLYGVTPFFAMPNILGARFFGGEPVVLERLCGGGEAGELAPVARALLEDGPARLEAVQRLRVLRERVFPPGATARAADALLEFLARRRL
ncbi:MAG: lipid-A-disaccharide synthase [Planctomycetes bacterium]|nr:lipid-A-disaccharide synthase [Planctomycetota bacterium]